MDFSIFKGISQELSESTARGVANIQLNKVDSPKVPFLKADYIESAFLTHVEPDENKKMKFLRWATAHGREQALRVEQLAMEQFHPLLIPDELIDNYVDARNKLLNDIISGDPKYISSLNDAPIVDIVEEAQKLVEVRSVFIILTNYPHTPVNHLLNVRLYVNRVERVRTEGPEPFDAVKQLTVVDI